jgi:iron(III) transport system ATP-binding protein
LADRDAAHGQRGPRGIRRGRIPASIAARLTYDDVSHRYDSVQAVRQFSLDIAPGEIVCLLGQSGCGKTTLLRLAAGVEEPSSGRILINNREVAGSTFVPPERRGVGLMFQDFALFPHLSNLANVMFGLRALPREDAEHEARLALERVGLGHMAEAYPHMLSGGEQQRVALARAVAPRPNVLLMDEPFSGLDRRLREEVRDDTLEVLRQSRVTCIVVTHDPEEALQMGDRIALMRAGRIVQVGAPETVYSSPADLFAARYFCPLNEFAATVRNGRVATPLGEFSAAGIEEGQDVIVGIRPQGIRLRPSGEGVAGRLESRRFLGEVDVVGVRIEGLDTPLRARLRERTAAARGSEVGVTADPAEVLVFAVPAA